MKSIVIEEGSRNDGAIEHMTAVIKSIIESAETKMMYHGILISEFWEALENQFPSFQYLADGEQVQEVRILDIHILFEFELCNSSGIPGDPFILKINGFTLCR